MEGMPFCYIVSIYWLSISLIKSSSSSKAAAAATIANSCDPFIDILCLGGEELVERFRLDGSEYLRVVDKLFLASAMRAQFDVSKGGTAINLAGDCGCSGDNVNSLDKDTRLVEVVSISRLPLGLPVFLMIVFFRCLS